MDAYFDNNSNVLNANIRTAYDKSVVYSLNTNFGLRGRKDTVLRDENPAFSRPCVVGVIHWRDKTFEIAGVKKRVSDIQRTEGGFFKKTRYWKWSMGRKEYELRYRTEGWQAILQDDDFTNVAAEFSVPFRPHLFSKPEPSKLELRKTALYEDEVFLLLVFIYSEAKRQDSTNSSSVNGGVGW